MTNKPETKKEEFNPNWDESFREMCKESYARGGFLTTDIDGNWEFDIDSMVSFISKAISEARAEERKKIFEELDAKLEKKCETCDRMIDITRWLPPMCEVCFYKNNPSYTITKEK